MSDDNLLGWEIRDETGVIHSGCEEEMRNAWAVLIAGDFETYCKEYPFDDDLNFESLKDVYDQYICDWEGDLELLEVHAIHR